MTSTIKNLHHIGNTKFNKFFKIKIIVFYFMNVLRSFFMFSKQWKYKISKITFPFKLCLLHHKHIKQWQRLKNCTMFLCRMNFPYHICYYGTKTFNVLWPPKKILGWQKQFNFFWINHFHGHSNSITKRIHSTLHLDVILTKYQRKYISTDENLTK